MKSRPSPLLRLSSRSTKPSTAGARPAANHTSFFGISLGMAVAGLATFGAPSARATSQTWDGGVGGTGTTLQTTTNWSGDTTVPTSGETATFSNTNGTGGDLLLTFDSTFTGGTNGVSFSVLGLHTGSLTIDPGTNTTSLRMKDITIEASAGAVTFGNGNADLFNLTFGSGNTGYTSNALTNNSSNTTATFKSDVKFASGGAITRALTFDGSGNWQVDAVLKPTQTGSGGAAGAFTVSKKGAGSLALNATNTGNNANNSAIGLQSITIEQGTLLAGATGALGGGGVTLGLTGSNSASLLNTGAFTQANNITVASSNTGTLTLGGNHTTGTSIYTGSITLNSNVVLSAATAGQVNFTTGVISGGGKATVSGGGTIGLSGANTYTGGTNLSNGIVEILADSVGTVGSITSGPLGTGTLTLNGGTLTARGASRTLLNAVTVGADFALNGTVAGGNNNKLTLAGNVNLGSATRMLTVGAAGGAEISGAVSGSGGGITKAGTSTTLTLSGTNTYTGTTSITGGTLVLSGTGAINNGSGITISGSDAKLLHTSSVAGTSAITLAQGTLDGTGTVGAVTLGTGGAILTNGNGTSSVLTTGALSFSGAATINLRSGTGIGIAAGTLTTSGTDGAITVNINRTGVWSNGANDLISFTSLTSPDINDFLRGSVTGVTLGARQSLGALMFNGSNLAIQIDGTSVYWTGASSDQWTTAAVQNLKTTSDNVATSFLAGDDLVFNDAPGTNQTVKIDDANVSTTTTTFNNSTAVNYTIASTSTFGISGGTLTKSGTGAVTLNTANTYAGGTTLNAGTLNVGNASALGTGALTITGGTLDNISGSAITSTTNNAQNWNGDFTFTGSNNLDLGAGAVTLGGTGVRTVTVTTNTLTVGEIKSGSQGLAISGGGTLVATSIGDGTAASSIGGTLNVGGGTTLQINRSTGNSAATTGDFVATGLTGAGTITNGASTYERWLIVNTTTSNTFTGALINGSTGALGLSKQGTGTLTLSGSNSYTGLTTVGGGTLSITGTNSVGGPVSVNGSAGTPAILNLQNSNALGTSAVTSTNRNSGIQLQGGITLPATVSFVTSNDGTTGATVPYAINNISGDNTINGTISLTLGGGGSVIQSDSGALTLAGNISIAAAQTSRGIVLQGASTSANTVSGLISNGSINGLASVTKTGAGTWALTAANTYTGATTVTAGKLSISSIANGGAASNIGQSANTAANLVLGGGTLQYTGATASTDRAFTLSAGTTSTIEVSSAGSNLAFSGASTATNGSLVKTGPGTLTLSGANGHTGSTNVSSGTLASGAAGGTLGGSVIVQSAAILAAGGAGTVGSATVGTPTSGSTTFNSGSIFSWDLNVANSADPGSTTTFDTVATASVAGDSGIGAVFQIVLAGSDAFAENFWSTSHSWNNIFTTNGTTPVTQNLASIFTSFTFANTNGSPSVMAPTTGSFTFTGSTLEFTAVPEPTSAIAGLLLGAGLLRRNRRNPSQAAV